MAFKPPEDMWTHPAIVTKAVSKPEIVAPITRRPVRSEFGIAPCPVGRNGRLVTVLVDLELKLEPG